MSSISKLWFGLLLLCTLALTACGGGSSGTPLLGDNPGDGSGPSVSDLQIKFTPASVDNTGTENVTATVTALSAAGQGLSGVPLTIKVDKNATFTSSGSTTATNGTVVANVTIGNDYSIRTVTLTASSGSLTRTATFNVTGSAQVASDIILTATPNALQNSLGNTSTVTATAVDANRNALPNIPVTLSVDQGGTIVPSGTVTGANGTLTAVVRMGADQSNRVMTVTATSGTQVRTIAVRVEGARLTASGFATTVRAGDADNSINYLLIDNTGAPMAGKAITVRASGLADVTGTTNNAGGFKYTYLAPSTAQTLRVVASAAGSEDTQSIIVAGDVQIPPAPLAVTAASLSASPNVVRVNVVATDDNQIEVRALFLGANNAPVKNVRVWFDLDGDKQSIGGTLASSAAQKLLYSDVNGIVRTSYLAGSRFSPKDGVTIRACWSETNFTIPNEGGACPNVVTNTLTVISESLSVSIGTNATIGIGDSGITYTKRYAVQVVDSAGQAKVGVRVTPSIDLLTYYKGEWRVGGNRWEQGGLGNSYPATYSGGAAVPTAGQRSPDTASSSWLAGNMSACDNEDLNRNGVAETFLDSLQGIVVPEDQNGSGSLVPQRPALDPRKADVTITVEGSTTTDSNGVVVLKIEYPQNVASWVRFNILVSASGVAGTEGRANYEGVLPVLAAAVTNINAEPAFRLSPYGQLGSPTYLRRNAEGNIGWLCTNPN